MTARAEFPLFWRELCGLLRTRRAFWLALTLVVGSALIPLIVWPSGQDIAVLNQLAGEVVGTFLLVQLTAAILIIPAFTAGAIAGERERDTLESLRATLVSPVAIAAAKVAAPVAYVVLLLLGASPAVCVLHLLGGVSFDQLARAYLVTFLAVVASGLICLVASLRARRTSSAAVLGMSWVVFWNGGLALIVGLLLVALTPFHQESANLVCGLSPHLAVLAAIGWMDGFARGEVVLGVNLALMSLVAGGHLMNLLVSFRRAGMEPPAARAARSAREPGPWSPDVGHGILRLGKVELFFSRNLIFLREVRSELVGRPWFRRACFFGPLALFLLVWAANVRHSVVEAERFGILALLFLTLIVPAVAAGSLPREVELGNLDLLRSTFLTPREVLGGKLQAGVHAGAGILAAAAGFIWCDGTPIDYLLRLGILGVTLVFTAACSLAAALLFRRAVPALVGAYLGLLALHLAGPLLSGHFRGSYDPWQRDLLEGMNAFLAFNRTAHDPGRPHAAVIFIGLYTVATILLKALSERLMEERWARDP